MSRQFPTPSLSIVSQSIPFVFKNGLISELSFFLLFFINESEMKNGYYVEIFGIFCSKMNIYL